MSQFTNIAIQYKSSKEVIEQLTHQRDEAQRACKAYAAEVEAQRKAKNEALAQGAVLRSMIFHNAFDHDFIKDEKVCKSCWTLKNVPLAARALLDRQADLESQIKRLADFIMANIPDEPSKSEGVVDTAIRLLDRLRRAEAVVEACQENRVHLPFKVREALAAWEEGQA